MRRAVAIWFPVAAIIAVAAVASVVALAEGRLGLTDGRIIVSGVAALLCGGAALASVELVERRQLRLLAWLALAGAVIEFAFMELGIWTFVDETSNRYARWAWTATVWLAPTLTVPTYALLVRSRRLAAWGLLFLVLCLVAFAGLFTGIIWTEGGHDTEGRITAILGILAVATYLVAPALARTLAPRRT